MTRLTIPNGLIREVRESDLSNLLEISKEKDILQNYFVVQNDKDIPDFWRAVLARGKSRIPFNCPNPPDVNLAIEYEGNVCGLLSFFEHWTPIEPDKTSLEISYFMGQKYRERGIMSESLRAMISHAFNDLSVGEIYAKVNVQNIPSIKTLEKVGFNRENQPVHMRSVTESRSGYIYSLDKDDFVLRGRR